MTARPGPVLPWLLLGVSLVTACAPLKTTTPASTTAAETAWLARRAELTALDRWLLQARIATSRVGWSGNLRWRQELEQFDIRVAGPLGAGGFHASGHAGRVEIRTSDESLVTQEPEALLQEKLGWSLPLRQLRYWAVGVPYPDSPAIVRFDAVGRLQAMEQDGWRLEYSEYGFYQHHELPRRFSLDNGDTTFRVVVDDWSEVG